ncbi:MAG TPA: alkaline phosphatase family protein [Candidatus Baltobacteraceae bacterium]|nr:alkaline phosphatase family protein [Candidatus Baltobacteraceae bacterium]
MKRSMCSVAAMAVALAACSGPSGQPAAPSLLPASYSARRPHTRTPIQHVVVVVQENRSYDNLFATFPGGDGTTTGKTPTGTIPLKKSPLVSRLTPTNDYPQCQRDYDKGKMDGFYTVPVENNPGRYVYRYVDPAKIVPYWTLAKDYVLADHMFQTQCSSSFTAHQDLIAAGTPINATEDVIDDPNNQPWACPAPTGTVTSLISKKAGYLFEQGPFPCLGYSTLRDSLDAKHVSWKYYVPQLGSGFDGNIWNAFAAIKAVYNTAEYRANVVSPETQVFSDITNGKLANVTWVIPDFTNSDHPGANSDTGPSWVAQVVNAIGQSQYWNSTAIVVVWDDWGGWYDHVPPPQYGMGELGFRVPMIAISPYARAGYVSHKQYEFGSIVKFIETTFGLPSLGRTDVRAHGFAGDFFNFKKPPRRFVPVPAKYSKSFFLHQRPSGKPVDTD